MRLALANLPDQAIVKHVVEGEKLLHPLRASIGRPLPLGPALDIPSPAAVRTKLQRPHLVEANDYSVFRRLLVEGQDAPFFCSNSGSLDCFQVLLLW